MKDPGKDAPNVNGGQAVLTPDGWQAGVVQGSVEIHEPLDEVEADDDGTHDN